VFAKACALPAQNAVILMDAAAPAAHQPPVQLAHVLALVVNVPSPQEPIYVVAATTRDK